MNTNAFRLLLLRWHRRLGLFAAVFLIWLAVSGILLNHTASLNLAGTDLPISIANTLAPLDEVSLLGVKTSIGLIEQNEQTLLLNGRHIEQCDGSLVGAILLDTSLWVACNRQVLELTLSGQLIESQSSYFGLPVPVSRIGLCDEHICIKANNQLHQFDALLASWKDDGEWSVAWSPEVTVSDHKAQLIPEVHNWERFILEAHSGRLFGTYGVLFFDIVAAITMLLSMSGCYVWWRQNRRRR